MTTLLWRDSKVSKLRYFILHCYLQSLRLSGTAPNIDVSYRTVFILLISYSIKRADSDLLLPNVRVNSYAHVGSVISDLNPELR